jgi:quercetin dioxygenase-like cupin family protein
MSRRTRGEPFVSGDARPRLLFDLHAGAGAGSHGVVWRLDEAGRQLDANALSLAPGQRIDTHTERDLDVLLVVVGGGGTLGTDAEPLSLAPGTLAWLPRGSTRGLTAGAEGLTYLTVHQRRPGMRIGPPPGSA